MNRKFSFFQDPIGWLFQDNTEPATPNQVPSGVATPINTTTVVGYLIVGGLVFYFGRKLIK